MCCIQINVVDSHFGEHFLCVVINTNDKHRLYVSRRCFCFYHNTEKGVAHDADNRRKGNGY